MLKNGCLNLSESETPTSLNGEDFLQVVQPLCFFCPNNQNLKYDLLKAWKPSQPPVVPGSWSTTVGRCDATWPCV